jgi:hypothetical protein
MTENKSEHDMDYLNATLKMMEDKAAKVRELDSKRKKEKISLRYQLQTLDAKYNRLIEPMSNTGLILSETVVQIIGGKLEFAEFIKKEKMFGEKFKYARSAFRARNTIENDGDKNEKTPADNKSA